jgi:hypothetical protein
MYIGVIVGEFYRSQKQKHTVWQTEVFKRFNFARNFEKCILTMFVHLPFGLSVP